MKKFFEYPINNQIKNYLLNYYQDSSLEQHSYSQKLKTGLKLKRISKMVKFNKNDVVLDVGCSKGYLLKKISSKIKKGIGVDISKNVIESAKKTNKRNNIQFFSYDGSHLNFKNKFDKIFLIDVLEHLFEPGKMLKNIHNLLADKGQLIIEVPFTGFLSELLSKKYHQGHLRYYDSDYLKEYLPKFNFEIEKIKIYNSVPFSSKLLKIPPLWKFLDFLINLIPNRIYPYFGEIIILSSKNERK